MTDGRPLVERDHADAEHDLGGAGTRRRQRCEAVEVRDVVHPERRVAELLRLACELGDDRVVDCCADSESTTHAVQSRRPWHGTVESMRTVLRGGDVFDGSGAAPAPGDVVIEDGRIVAVGPGLDGDDEIDCDGRTVLPGFIDSHVHFMGRRRPRPDDIPEHTVLDELLPGRRAHGAHARGRRDDRAAKPAAPTSVSRRPRRAGSCQGRRC